LITLLKRGKLGGRKLRSRPTHNPEKLEHSKVITFIHLKIDFLLYYSSSNMGVLLSFFVTCVVCVFGINQVLLELCKAESQFLVPWRVNTGTMFNFCVEIIC